MKESIFNIKKKEKNNLIIFNTRNKKIIKMNEKDYNTILELDEKNELYQNGFIVENDRDEYRDFLFDFKKNIYNTRYMTITYLTTNKCNFRCVYCFEGEEIKHKTEQKINLEDFKKIYNKILQYSKASIIDFNFFGGEPLLEYQHIIDVLKFLNGNTKTKVAANIVTNGYLLDKTKIRELKKAGVTSFQITVDGAAEIHNRYRKLINGDATFDTIMKNIINILDENIETILNINFCLENYKQIEKFLREMPSIIKSKAYIKFNQIQETINNKYVSGIDSKNEDINILDYLLNIMKEEEYPDNDYEFLEAGPCAAQLKNSIILERNGNISKCIYGIGDERFILGNALEDMNCLQKVFVKDDCLMSKLNSQCAQCPYLPMCKGGCKRKCGGQGQVKCEILKYKYLTEAILNYYS